MDAEDLQRRWKEVVKTCASELSMASPSNKAKWEKAKQAAEKVVESLAPILAIEDSACAAWQVARQEPSNKPKPSLKIVS